MTKTAFGPVEINAGKASESTKVIEISHSLAFQAYMAFQANIGGTSRIIGLVVNNHSLN